MDSLPDLVRGMIEAATAAGAVQMRYFRAAERPAVTRKGPADFVSAADLESERILKEHLGRLRPQFAFVGEEGGRVAGSDAAHAWVVDPLDGTTNFLRGIVHFAVNVALVRDGAPVAAVTYAPASQELYWAAKGKGAFLRVGDGPDERLSVSRRETLKEALLATGVPFAGKAGHATLLAELSRITDQCAGIRRLGAAAVDLAYVAAGRFDAYWERGLNAWDMAAGALLVTEAGGTVTGADGEPLDLAGGTICAANPRVHAQVIARLAAPAPGSRTGTSVQ